MEKDLISELEEKHGGKITYRTYAVYYADSNGNVKNHGVLVYQIGDTFHFEDFEEQRAILGIPIKDKVKYVKFESSFEAKDVKATRLVSRKNADSFCKGYISHDKLRNPGLFTRLFSEMVTELEMADGSYLFFRFMDNTIEKKINQK